MEELRGVKEVWGDEGCQVEWRLNKWKGSGGGKRSEGGGKRSGEGSRSGRAAI